MKAGFITTKSKKLPNYGNPESNNIMVGNGYTIAVEDDDQWVLFAMLISSSALKGLPSLGSARLPCCMWFSSEGDKKREVKAEVVKETAVEEPTIKINPEDSVPKKSVNPLNSATVKPSAATSFYLDTHHAVLQLQTAGYVCACPLALTGVCT